MTKHNAFPFEYKDWEEVDGDTDQYYDVKFTEDFGLFKKDDSAKILAVDLADRVIEEYDDQVVLKRQLFKIIPI